MDSKLIVCENQTYTGQNRETPHFNPIALRKAKIVSNFGLSECNRVKTTLSGEATPDIFTYASLLNGDQLLTQIHVIKCS